ncbi:DedA family protein [Actinokineospora auranticolor]|uniref:Membrane protein DedA with SNARE-associated domain n=1 Tax=Actinokineospora auranticolor TaxID=155976 RepID=A0A2S6GUB5_9PSEU|nr:DedA family protein [Actinokineospora auranticolor]PPK68786.1 membrane protein DedA with SNARE-associated domain [Actinokineospora auranticolor]
MAGWALDVMDVLGAPGAGLLVALENLFPPLPSEIFLPLAGFAAGLGRISLFSAIFFTTLGSVAGALALYWLGAALGRDRLRAIADRVPLLKVSDVDKTEAWFDRHGGKAVFFGRMVPVFRSLISIPAGVHRMPLARFTLLTTLGSLIWNTAFVLAGYLLGQQWHLVEDYAGILEKVVLGAVVLAVAWFVVQRVRGARRDRVSSSGRRDRPRTR